MRKILATVLLLFSCIFGHAQDALVVAVCGTLPSPYAVGSTRLWTVDTTGKLCGSGGTPGGSDGQVQYNNAGAFGGLSNTQLTARINAATAALSGALPAWPNNTTTFFRGDGTYVTLNAAALSGLGTNVATALGNTAGGAGGFALVGTTPPTGAAGGALAGTYPNPTLASTITAGGPTGSATATPIITYNAAGQLTAVSSATITPAIGSVTGLGSNVATFLATPSSANLAAAVTDESGNGALLFANGNIGTATGTSLALGGATIGTDALGVTGTATVSASINSPSHLLPLSATAAENLNLSGRIGIGFPVPYFTPTTTNKTIAFDVFPKGTPSDNSSTTGVAWADICSTDINADGTNYECLRMGKLASGIAHVSAAKGGTGTVRNLALQLNGGNVGVGTATPTSQLDVINFARVLGSAAFANPPSSGSGLELYYNTSTDTAYVEAYNRTGSVYKALNLDGTTLSLNVGSSGPIVFGGTSAVSWTSRGILSSPAAGSLQFGAADAASPVAQIIKFQSGSGTNINGQTATIIGSLSTGASGVPGDIALQTGITGSGTVTAGAAVTALLIKGVTQHIKYGGSAPVVSACGTGSPSIDATATDSSGTVTVGTVAAGCTITFNKAYTTSNHCRVTSQGSISGLAYSYTLAAITVSASVLGGDLIDYHCDGV